MKRKWYLGRLLAIGLLAGSLGLFGCKGDDGKDVDPSTVDNLKDQIDGVKYKTDTASEACQTCHGDGSVYSAKDYHENNWREPAVDSLTITGVTLNDDGADGTVTVAFDAGGAVPDDVTVRVAHLDGDNWVGLETGIAGDDANVVTADASTFEFTIPDVTFTYGDTYRVVMHWNGTEQQTVSDYLDFAAIEGTSVNEMVADGGSKRVVDTETCFRCHDWDMKRRYIDPFYGESGWDTVYSWYYGNGGHHSDDRVTLESCVICHNEYGTIDSSGKVIRTVDGDGTVTYNRVNDGGNRSNLAYNTHRRHSSSDAEHDLHDSATYAGGQYPTNPANCLVCHSNETVETQRWKTEPSRLACGGCHTDIAWENADVDPDGSNVLHSGGQQVNDNQCSICHGSAAIEKHHAAGPGSDGSAGNPRRMAKYSSRFLDYEELLFARYEIDSVEANADNQPVVTFRIMKSADQGATESPIIMTADGLDDTDLTASTSFLVAYALPQDGVDTPSDYNNLGEEAGQPASVSLTDALADTSSWEQDGNGWVTMTLDQAWPDGATMRTVGIQSYLYENVDGEDQRLPVPSVVGSIAGEERAAGSIKTKSCLECHDVISFHGGNRVIGYDYTQFDDVDAADAPDNICVLCHNPNLSSSGKTEDLTHPEDSNNLKDMLHGIHAAGNRDASLKFFRGGSHGGLYEFTGKRADSPSDDAHLVGFPGNVTRCATCHDTDGLWANVEAESLLSTILTTDGENATIDDVAAARESMPNLTDLVVAPASATCYACHAADSLRGHIRTNEGGFRERRLMQRD